MASRRGCSPLLPDRIPDTELLTDIRPMLGETTQFIANGFSTPEGNERIQSIQNDYINAGVNPDSKLPGSLPKLQVKFAHAAGNLVMHTVEAGQEEEYIDQLLDSIASDYKMFMPGAHLVSACAPTVIEISRDMRILQSFVEAIVPSLNAVAVSADAQAGLMRLLAYRPAFAEGADQAQSSDIASLQVLYTYAALDENKSTIAPHITTQLEAGELDTPIAKEVFSEQEKSSQVRSLVKFAAYLTGKTVELPEAVEKLAGPEGLTLLLHEPYLEPYRRVLMERRAQYLQNLNRNFEDNKGLLIGNLSDPGKKTKDEVALLADEMVEELARIRATSLKIRSGEKAGASRVMHEIRTQKRRRMAKMQAATETTKKPTAEPEVPKQLQKLVVIRPDGTAVSKGEPGYSEIFEDFLANNQSETGLADDIQKIQEFLTQPWPKSGKPLGITGINGGRPLKRGQTKFPKAFELRVQAAQNMSMTSPRGSKLRVFFVRDEAEGTVGILGIAHKEDAQKVMRQIGVTGRPRSRSRKNR